MVWQEIDIDGYWLATIVYIPSQRDLPSVAEALSSLGCPDSDINESLSMMTEEWNKGYTWSNPARRKSVTIIGRSSSWEQFFNTVHHEARHIVDEIMMAYDIMNYGEPPAYTQGEIGRQMAPVIRRIVCPCCGMTN